MGEPLEGTIGRADSRHSVAAREPQFRVSSFVDWLERNRSRFADRWFADLVARDDHVDDETRVLRDFVTVFSELLPKSLGPHRDQVESFWCEAAELYGSVGGARGLVAGEVVEEFQLLREAVFRAAYTEPPSIGLGRVALRDLLRLNRLIDRGVAQASVGHTDALFFAFFQGSGVSRTLSPEAVSEIREQLARIREDLFLTGSGWHGEGVDEG